MIVSFSRASAYFLKPNGLELHFKFSPRFSCMELVRRVLFIFIYVSTISLFAQSVRLDFTIDHFEGDTLFLGYHLGSQKYLQDTLLRQHNGHYESSIDDPVKGVYFLYSPSYYQEFIMDGQSFQYHLDKDVGITSLKVTGSPENEYFRDFQVDMTAMQTEYRQLFERLKAGGPDSLEVRSKMVSLDSAQRKYRQDFVEGHPGTFVAAFVRLMDEPTVPEMDELPEADRRVARYQYFKNHFLDDVDMSEEGMLRTPVLHQKVIKYLDSVVPQQPDSINVAIDKIFAKIGSQKEMYRYWLVTLFKRYAESKIMGMDAVMIHLIENYYLNGQADWITEEYRKQLKEEATYVKYNLIGKPAPPLNVVDTLMQPFDLSQVKADYTLLFIYDPDCGHCKKAIKKLEKQEDDLHENGIQVVAVCTTSDVGRWKEFVAAANPFWYHAIDPTGKSYFRVYYDVRSTPRMYLLDEDKVIIGKKLEVDQMIDIAKRRNKLEEK